MGKIATTLSDKVLTSDNPRNEDSEIVNQMLEGVSKKICERLKQN